MEAGDRGDDKRRDGQRHREGNVMVDGHGSEVIPSEIRRRNQTQFASHCLTGVTSKSVLESGACLRVMTGTVLRGTSITHGAFLNPRYLPLGFEGARIYLLISDHLGK